MKCLGKYDHNYINLIMQLNGLYNSKKKRLCSLNVRHMPVNQFYFQLLNKKRGSALFHFIFFSAAFCLKSDIPKKEELLSKSCSMVCP